MPYRIKKGQEVLLIMKDAGRHGPPSTKTVMFSRTVDFNKAELVSSPLDEHIKDGIPPPEWRDYPWGFSVADKWSKGDSANDVLYLYAKEVHSIRSGTSKKVNTVVVQGSKDNQYTVTLNDHDIPISCTCPAARFRQLECKHMRRVTQGTL